MPETLKPFPSVRDPRSSSLLASLSETGQAVTDRPGMGRSGLREMKAPYSQGLGIVTKALFEAKEEVANPRKVAEAYKEYTGRTLYVGAMTVRARNACFANLVREVCVSFGWLEGWICLTKVHTSAGLHEALVADIVKSKEVYIRLGLGTRLRPTIDVHLTVGRQPEIDAIDRLGPKTASGYPWKASIEYATLGESWKSPDFSYGPCIAFNLAVLHKTRIPPHDMSDCMALQLANLVAFDLNQLESNNAGFYHIFSTASGACDQVDASIHGPAMTAMLTFDFQTYVRQIQQAWADRRNGNFAIGPEDVSPEDWVSTQIGDYASLMPFAYDDASEYELSRTTLFGTITLAACHDLVFDIGFSNRMSNLCYAEAAGVAEHGVHAAFAIGMLEEVVKRISHLGDGEHPLYGDCCLTSVASWIPFSSRYRLWERVVKYIRLLKTSEATEAKVILDMAHRDLVMKDLDLDRDCADSWASAISPDAPSSLTARQTVPYFIPPVASELLTTPGVSPPDLCASCTEVFEVVIYSDQADEVHAAVDLPPRVTSSRAAGLAAGIRRAALWATEEDCCDICACRIGHWADDVGYVVQRELMKDEAGMSASAWFLECYFAGTVCFWPISVPTLLSCFDLVADLSFDDDAVGQRDAAD